MPTRAQLTEPIPEHQATYWVYYNSEKVGEINFVLEKANDEVWYAQTQTKATTFLARTLGSDITEASHFVWIRDGSTPTVLPLTYHHVSREPFRTRFWQHRYNWETMTSASLTHQGEQTIQLREGLIDPLALRFAMAGQLAVEGPPSEPSSTWTFWVLDRDDVELQRVEYLGEEIIDVGAGCFVSEHFYRQRKPNSPRNYHVWVAAANAWLPIKFQQQDGNKVLSIELVQSDLLTDIQVCAPDREN